MGFVASDVEERRISNKFNFDGDNDELIDFNDDDTFGVDASSGSDRRRWRHSAKRPRSSTGSSDGDGESMSVGAERWPTVRLNLRSWIDSDEVQHGNDCVEFSLTRVLGAGGFGRVFLASSTSKSADQLMLRADEGATCRNRRNRRCRRREHRPVVIKLLTSTATGKGGVSASATSSLQSESNAIDLDHPNVVRVLAAGWTTATASVFDAGNSHIRKWSTGAVDQLMRAATAETSMAAIVMEFAGQSNLQSILEDSCESIDLRRRVSYACDISSALSYLHSKSIIHLDVKPANVIVSRLDDRCKLTDFGCSRRLADVTTAPPSTSSVSSTARAPSAGKINAPPGGSGTVQYRAPELLSLGAAAAVAARRPGCGTERACKADVYSFGVTLWQLAERRIPFVGLFDSTLTITYNVVKYAARPDGSTTSPYRLVDDDDSTTTGSAISADEAEDGYRRVYVKCWDADVDCRPTAEELVKVFDVWFRH